MAADNFPYFWEVAGFFSEDKWAGKLKCAQTSFTHGDMNNPDKLLKQRGL